ncbi:MAG: hypothetical protein N3A53_03130 [Verrucomicrobiae bacterium]|nr:hypothetical protein [Verrucomicrobiae bacterium]
MKPITPSCRDGLTARDREFVADVLGGSPRQRAAVRELLQDENARDSLLEKTALRQALLESREPLAVSPQLYFYVLTRWVLPGLDRITTDYIATLLVEFLQGERWRTVPGFADQPTEYVTDMLLILAHLKGEQAFLVQTHVGNYALFLTGVFADHVRYRAQHRGAPDIGFYEEVGRAHYQLAARQPYARRHGLDDVLETVGEEFPTVRRGLNRLADQFWHWGASA